MSRKNKSEGFAKPVAIGVQRLTLAFVLLAGCILLPRSQAQTFSVIYGFTGGTGGSGPSGQLLLDASGNLFGGVNSGGDLSCNKPFGCGLIFKLDSSGTLTVLHTFSDAEDGSEPFGNMVSDASHNLYGTTAAGGDVNLVCTPGEKPTGCGVAFKLNTLTGKFTVLHRFAGGASDGSEPNGLIRDEAGNLYGTTFLGGNAGCGSSNGSCGILYKIDPTGKFTLLYSFTGGADGGLPINAVRDKAGNLYGTTINGGDLNCESNPGTGPGCGTVFEFTTAGALKVLHTFTGGQDGADNAGAIGVSEAGLIQNSAGNLLGVAPFGGHRECKSYPGCGVVYRVSTAGKETILHAFTGGSDGSMPDYGLTSDSAGNLYGTTVQGGDTSGICNPLGCGTVFKLDLDNQLTTLYSFTDGADGLYPSFLTSDASGNLYGVAQSGYAQSPGGVIFKITQ